MAVYSRRETAAMLLHRCAAALLHCCKDEGDLSVAAELNPPGSSHREAAAERAP
jgi:hypothetical protein